MGNPYSHDRERVLAGHRERRPADRTCDANRTTLIEIRAAGRAVGMNWEGGESRLDREDTSWAMYWPPRLITGLEWSKSLYSQPRCSEFGIVGVPVFLLELR